jgi:hypothetical protein
VGVSDLYNIPFFGDFAEWGAPTVDAISTSVSSDVSAIGGGISSAVSSAVSSVVPSKTSLYAGGIGIILVLFLLLLLVGKFEAI